MSDLSLEGVFRVNVARVGKAVESPEILACLPS